MTDIQMTVKSLQKTDETAQLELIKSSKLFYKLDASILPHSSLTKQKKYPKVTKPNTTTYCTNTKDLNQINIIKQISIKIALKYLKH